MYQRFTVESMSLLPQSNSIVLSFTLDLDEDTVNDRTIYITETKTGMQPVLSCIESFAVDGRTVELHYKNFEVNKSYEIHVTHGIRSIMDEPLSVEYVKEFLLESEVDSTVAIVSPSDHEAVGKLRIRLKETAGANGKLFNSFAIEIADDASFLDVLLATTITDTDTVTLTVPKPAHQYFLRARTVSGDDFGNWSEPVTFTMAETAPANSGTEIRPTDPPSDDMPAVIEDMELVSCPENGVTPESFLFAFDADIDPASVNPVNILIIRKKV